MTPDRIFRALGDPARLAIVELLLERDGQALFELCARLIAAGTAITRQGVAKHIAVLVDADIIEVVRDGRTTRHRLVPSTLAIARQWLEAVDSTPSNQPTQEQP